MDEPEDPALHQYIVTYQISRNLERSMISKSRSWLQEVNYVAERKAKYEHEWAREFEEKAKEAGVAEYKAKVQALG